MNQDVAQSKAFNILKKGYMPTDSKNLLTFSVLTALFVVSNAASFTLGHQQSSLAIQNDISVIKGYAQLEAQIIRNHKESLLVSEKMHQSPTPYMYYDENGVPTQIYGSSNPPPSIF